MAVPMTTVVFACGACGALTEEKPAGVCPECGATRLFELDGPPSAESRAALLAWARRDYTRLVENQAFFIGGGLGIVLGAAGGAALGDALVGCGLAVYLGMALALWGPLVGPALFERRFPRAQLLRPTQGHVRRRALWLTAWLTLPAALALAIWTFGGSGDFAARLRQVAGRLMAWLMGD